MVVPESERGVSRQPIVLGATLAMTIIASSGVFLRVVARLLSRTPFWWDDYFAFAALLTSYMTDSCNFAGLHYGLGRHTEELPKGLGPRYLLILYILQTGYVVTVTLVKFSILLFYWRLFNPKAAFRRCVWVIGILTLAWYLATQITIWFQCTPVKFFWNRHLPGGHCINSNLFYLVTSALLPPLDFAILFLAIPMVRQVKVSIEKRVGIVFILSLGTFVSICCIVRLTVLHEINPEDITWSNVIPGVWSNAEASVGVFCACLPTLGPLFSMARKKGDTTENSNYATSMQSSGYRQSQLPGGFQRIDDPPFPSAGHKSWAGTPKTESAPPELELGEIVAKTELTQYEENKGLAVNASHTQTQAYAL